MGLYLLCFILFLVGLYGVIAKKNLVKIIIGLGIMSYAVNLFFILIGYRHDAVYPILEKGRHAARMVDPLPQALILTSIVVELAVTALLVALAVRIYEKYKTFDITKIRRLKG
ncbi:MAG: sodium:proton antiporter [Bacillota bacterium]